MEHSELGDLSLKYQTFSFYFLSKTKQSVCQTQFSKKKKKQHKASNQTASAPKKREKIVVQPVIP